MTPVNARFRPMRQAAIGRSRASYPEPSQMFDAIVDTFASADESTVAAGLSWYSHTAAQAVEYVRTAALAASGQSLTFPQAAGIIAALSPATGWGDNTAGAIEFAVTGAMLAQVPLFNSRAAAIFDGAEPLSVLGGRKVRSFYRNIADPTNPGPVTVDRHAISLTFGVKLSERQLKPLAGNVGGYAYCAAAYRAAARYLNLVPNQVQAVTWLAWRQDNTYRGRNGDLPHNTTEEF